MMQIKSFDLVPNGIAFLWQDGSDSLILYPKLRNACPCAYCSGETDFFGNGLTYCYP